MTIRTATTKAPTIRPTMSAVLPGKDEKNCYMSVVYDYCQIYLWCVKVYCRHC